MKQRDIEPTQYATSICYIVCQSIGYNKKLTETQQQAILTKIARSFENGDASARVFLTKEEAQLEASEFSAREVPFLFNMPLYQRGHSLAKPIVCLSLESPLLMGKGYTTTFYINRKERTATSYSLLVSALPALTPSNWTLLLDEHELRPANNNPVPISQQTANAHP